MTTSNWLGGNGFWGTAADWSDGVPDSAGDTAILDGSDPYTVTISAPKAFTVGTVSIGDAAATLAVEGTLTLSGDLSPGAGSLKLARTGVLAGGTIVTGTGTISFGGGTLDGCEVVGPLDLDGAHQSVVIENALTVEAVGGGAGLISFGSDGGTIVFEGSQIFNDATIASQAGRYNSIQTTGTLTLGNQVDIDAASSAISLTGVDIANDGTIATSGSSAGIVLNAGTFTNSGVLDLAGYLSGISISGTKFTNHGDISVTGARALLSSYATTFVNAADGSMTVASGGTIDLGEDEKGFLVTRFDNAGTIVVDSGGSLNLSGYFFTKQIGELVNNGDLQLKGRINNTGSALTFGSGGLGGNVILYGTIQGGTVVSNSTSLVLRGVLDDVAWRGALNVGSYNEVAIENGGTISGLNGTGPGTITVQGSEATLNLLGSQTIDNATIYLGAFHKYGLNDTIQVSSIKPGAKATVTLGVDLSVVAAAAGSTAYILPSDYYGPINLVNDGTIVASAAKGHLEVEVPTFTNNGDIAVSNGDYANFQFVKSFTNTGTITLSGNSSMSFNGSGESGSISVAAGSYLGIDGAFTQAMLAGIQNQGTVAIGGKLDNVGGTITIGTGPLFGGQLTELVSGGQLDASGEIFGGELVLGSGAIGWDGGSLEDVQVQGAINLAAAGASVWLDNVTLTGAGGVGAGVINLSGASSSLYFSGSQILNNTTITMGDAGAQNGIVLVADGTQVVTLGAGTTLDANVASSTIVISYLDQVSTVDLVNRGTINAGASEGNLFVELPTFTNLGHLTVSNGDTVYVDGTINGRGAISLSDAKLTLGAVETGQRVIFGDGAGSLTLTAAGNFDGEMTGLQAGDRIDLAFVKATSLTLSGSDQLVVSNGTTVAATLQLKGSYQMGQFNLTGDGAGGSLITVQAASMSQAMASMTSAGEAVHWQATGQLAHPTPLLFHGS